MTSVPEEQR